MLSLVDESHYSTAISVPERKKNKNQPTNKHLLFYQVQLNLFRKIKTELES